MAKANPTTRMVPRGHPLRPADLTRRTTLLGAAAIAVLPASMATALPKPPADAELLRLGAELETAWAHERVLDADDAAPFSATDEAVNANGEIADAIGAIPATTIAGLHVKARAVAWCYGGGYERDLQEKDGTTDALLLNSIVRDLLGMGGRHV